MGQPSCALHGANKPKRLLGADYKHWGVFGRDVLERGGGGHLPFQVLDASAIEGIRGLAGESLSIYSCIQIYIRRGGGGV